ncbi:hypothetical protein BJF93_21875 [Xaviernesmea oryzae]|uniref:histidine kinase n=1 Tax=Xaviernesmea oryzae TaxID=464029 RepID=A0A1Q9AWD3_9HYPH|nr:hypothetical protein BJF93_21875 [Xaviernesmea oryzae]
MDVHEEPSPNPVQVSVPDRLEYRLKQQRIAAEFGYFALKTWDLDELLQEATRLAALGLNATHAKYLRPLGNGAGFLVVAGVGWKSGVVGHARVGDDLESPAGYAYHTETAVISNHLENEERFRTPLLLAEHGITRALNVIIRCDVKKYGVLEVDSPGEGMFDEADISFLENFAAILGVAMQRAERDEQLKEASALQEVLVQEASHRVKNSLSVVAGLLAMQARTAENDDVARALRDAGQRVQTVASVHDRLWKNNTVRIIGLGTFLRDLSEQLQATTSGVTVRCRVDDVDVLTQQAVTMGLLVNELVTNAVKYAYDEQGGFVDVEVRPSAEGCLVLSVEDQGRGLPDKLDTSGGSSLGLRLIASLSRQLGGEPRWERLSPGTRFTVTFLPASDS